MGKKVAVLGATGMVGREMLQVLEQREFPVSQLVPLASERSADSQIIFCGESVRVRRAEPGAFKGVEIVLASAGAAVSRELLPHAANAGAISIDNSSAFRMDPEVPLVVPEVNAHRIADHKARGIIANPNCSTIQLVVALKPLHDFAHITHCHVSTYQSVSGAGAKAMRELTEAARARLDGKARAHEVFSRSIAFDVLPEIDIFMPDGATKEEHKMRNETRKIMEADIALDATCVRVPVFRGHSEAVWIQTREPLDPDRARALLAAAPGITVIDDPARRAYPTTADADGRDAVFVGRIRRDPSRPNGLAFWVVSDNLRKGAALNAVQIAEALI